MGSPNCWDAGLTDVRAVCLHTMVGTLASCDAEFRSVGNAVSAHYGVGLDGTVHGYVGLQDAAWANGVLEAGNRWEPLFGSGNPNRRTISIETEDLGFPGTQKVTPEQYASVGACARWAMAAWPGITHLVAHCAISPLSRTCPAARWLKTGMFDQLAAELGLIALK